jgi:hypothetical protein
MLLRETDYLVEYSISIKEYQRILQFVGKSKYGKLRVPTELTKQELRNLQKLLKKFRDADLIKEVKGELRINPYFYLQPNLEDSVIKKLKEDWDNPESKGYIGAEFITDPDDGVVYKVWMENNKVKFREARIEDYE